MTLASLPSDFHRESAISSPQESPQQADDGLRDIGSTRRLLVQLLLESSHRVESMRVACALLFCDYRSRVVRNKKKASEGRLQ